MSKSSMPDTTPHNGHRILVVEDEPLVALYLEDVLDTLGYDCCGTAGTAEEAVSLAETKRPTLALVDIGLCGDDGIVLACELRERFGIGAIFLSGSVDAETRQRAEIAQPRGFLSKPCLEDELAEALRVALQATPRTVRNSGTPP